MLCGSAREPIRSANDKITQADWALPPFHQRGAKGCCVQPTSAWSCPSGKTFSSSSCRICVLCGTLPLSLEICKMAGKPSRALRSHSLNLLLNSRTDFRYWILTSSRKSGRRISSRPCRERIQQYDLACCGRCCQHLTQGPGRHGRSERGH